MGPKNPQKILIFKKNREKEEKKKKKKGINIIEVLKKQKTNLQEKTENKEKKTNFFFWNLKTRKTTKMVFVFF
jgi:DNA-directed RNA polymerase subunit M/transcription elongation factor TFIIS